MYECKSPLFNCSHLICDELLLPLPNMNISMDILLSPVVLILELSLKLVQIIFMFL
jgi:hypothetical protein